MGTTADIFHFDFSGCIASVVAWWQRIEGLSLEEAGVLHGGVVGGGNRVDFIVDNDFDFNTVDLDEFVRSHGLFDLNLQHLDYEKRVQANMMVDASIR